MRMLRWQGLVLPISAVSLMAVGVLPAAATPAEIIGAPPWESAARAGATLTASDGRTVDSFGWTVAVSGDTAVIGAPGQDGVDHNEGAAYVFVRSGATWVQQAKLTASDAAVADNFGERVDIDGDTIVVGAEGTRPAAVYVFVGSGSRWTQQAKLTSSDWQPLDYFGWSLAISRDTIVVGAPLDSTVAGREAGSAYVFFRSGTTWFRQAKLTAPDGAAADGFGSSVDVGGSTVLVGASGHDGTVPGGYVGSVYVFVRTPNSWVLQAQLTPFDGAGSDAFGTSVALDGDTAVVGSLNDNGPPEDGPGAAYVYTRSGSTWSMHTRLSAPAELSGDSVFGSSVAVSGPVVVVGMRRPVQGPIASGSVFLFVRSATGWTRQGVLTPPDSGHSRGFGLAVAVDGSTALAGAFLADTVDVEKVGAVRVVTW